jgi:hypothetical protein
MFHENSISSLEQCFYNAAQNLQLVSQRLAAHFQEIQTSSDINPFLLLERFHKVQSQCLDVLKVLESLRGWREVLTNRRLFCFQKSFFEACLSNDSDMNSKRNNFSMITNAYADFESLLDSRTLTAILKKTCNLHLRYCVVLRIKK